MFGRDTIERAAKTFVQTFLGTLAVSLTVPSDLGNLNAWKSMGLAAIVASVSAGLSALSSLMSRRVGTPNMASILSIPPSPPLCDQAGDIRTSHG